MKRVFAGMQKTMEIISSLLLFASILCGVLLFASFFLNLFGILSYDPPMHDADNVISIELVDTSGSKEIVLKTLTENQMQLFLNEFLQIRFKRYANDPPEPYGDRMVRIVYLDGYVDCIGEEMNQRLDPFGQWVSAKGWYYCPDDSLEILFDKYVN